MRQRIRDKFDFATVVTVLSFVFFGLFLIYPLIRVFASSFIDSESGLFTLKNFTKFFSRRYYFDALLNSLKVTLCVTVIAAILGTAFAFVMKITRIVGKTFLNVIIIISILSPPFIGAYSWILLLGRNGAITQFFNDVFHVQLPGIYGFNGILLVFALKLFPMIYLFVIGALKGVDNSLFEAAESLGCVGLKRIFKIVIPLILPTLLASSLLVFMLAMADFGTPMLIGEGYKTMPVLIYNEFISEVGGDDGFAAALSIITIFITTVIFLSQRYISRKKSYTTTSMNPLETKRIKGGKNVLAHIFCYLLVLLAIIPQLVVVYTSFLKTSGGKIFLKGFSLDSYGNVFSTMGNAILHTYIYSFFAILMIVVIGVLVSYVCVRHKNTANSLIDTLTMFPYIIPGSVLGIALLISFNDTPLLFSGTAFIIILAWVLRRMPYTIRSSTAILQQTSVSVEEAAISLGASNLKAFLKVTLPIMIPGVMSGAILSWMSLITELSASVLLYTGQTVTLTISIYTEVIRANYGNAAALSSILTFTTVITLLIFFKITGKKEIEL